MKKRTTCIPPNGKFDFLAYRATYSTLVKKSEPIILTSSITKTFALLQR